MAGSATAEGVALPFAGVGFAPAAAYESRLWLVPALAEVPAQTPEVPAIEWRDADSITGLRLAREAAATEAERILASRTQLLAEDIETTEVPNPVDPLTTAGRVLQAEEAHGADSPERKEAWASLVHDCARLLGEAYRKNRWEYFAETEQPYDEAADDYTFMGYSLTTMVTQGITPMAQPEEQINRTAEFVEEATAKAARKLGSLAIGNMTLLKPGRPAFPGAAEQDGPEARMMTVSECPDWAIAAYQRKSKGGWGGYAPESEKLMLRGVRFANTGSRFQEQLGLPGTLITHDVVLEAMQEMQVVGGGERLTKDEVRRKQLFNLSGQDVFAFARVLDRIAGERSGQPVFLGEAVNDDHPRDYEAARQEAAARASTQEQQAQELADFLVTLERSGIDHWPAQGIVEKQVHKMIFEGVKGDAEAAAAAFDDKTAKRIEEANTLRASGNEAAARRLEQKAEAEAPAASFCGAGSCGLKEMGKDKEKALRDKLGSEEDEQLLEDTERCCKDCGKMTVVYSFNERVVRKLCTSCGAKAVEKTE